MEVATLTFFKSVVLTLHGALVHLRSEEEDHYHSDVCAKKKTALSLSFIHYLYLLFSWS